MQGSTLGLIPSVYRALIKVIRSSCNRSIAMLECELGVRSMFASVALQGVPLKIPRRDEGHDSGMIPELTRMIHSELRHKNYSLVFLNETRSDFLKWRKYLTRELLDSIKARLHDTEKLRNNEILMHTGDFQRLLAIIKHLKEISVFNTSLSGDLTESAATKKKFPRDIIKKPHIDLPSRKRIAASMKHVYGDKFSTVDVDYGFEENEYGTRMKPKRASKSYSFSFFPQFSKDCASHAVSIIAPGCFIETKEGAEKSKENPLAAFLAFDIKGYNAEKIVSREYFRQYLDTKEVPFQSTLFGFQKMCMQPKQTRFTSVEDYFCAHTGSSNLLFSALRVKISGIRLKPIIETNFYRFRVTCAFDFIKEQADSSNTLKPYYLSTVCFFIDEIHVFSCTPESGMIQIVHNCNFFGESPCIMSDAPVQTQSVTFSMGEPSATVRALLKVTAVLQQKVSTRDGALKKSEGGNFSPNKSSLRMIPFYANLGPIGL